jgi:mono/diheme cytochrome c family protein
MRFARGITFPAIVLLVVVAGTWSLSAAQRNSSRRDVERGKYLVEEVAKCTECHTPRDQNNQLIRGQWLQGAPIWIKPVAPITNWADSAPKLAGLPSYTDEQVKRVLENGQGATGMPIQPPMHIYHMNDSDATAIIAYLRSLSGSAPPQQ